MLDLLGLDVSAGMFFDIMITLSFLIGIILIVSPEAFDFLNRALQKEYGLKTRLFPRLEDTSIDLVDKTIIKNRTICGLILSIVSFILLLIFR